MTWDQDQVDSFIKSCSWTNFEQKSCRLSTSTGVAAVWQLSPPFMDFNLSESNRILPSKIIPLAIKLVILSLDYSHCNYYTTTTINAFSTLQSCE